MRVLYLLAMLIACPFLLHAQSNFKPAYVVTLTGDTVKGEIDYREWDNNPESIRFRSAGNKVQNYTVADISYFNIAHLDAYQRFSGPISRDETNSNRVIGGRDTSFTVKDVFLKVLQTGKTVNLYSYTDAIKPRYFYSAPNTGTTITELVYRVYYNGNTSGNLQKSNTTVEATYLQQLTAVALKANLLDDRLQATIDGAEYTRPALLKIVTMMNGYTKEQLTANQSGGSSDSFDMYAGLGLNVTTTKSFDTYNNPIGTPNTSILPKAAFGIIAYVNPDTRKLQFSLELSVTDIKYKNAYGNTNYSFDQLVTTLTPAVSYNIYNGKNFKFYASLGLGLNKYTYTNKKFVRNDGTDISMVYFPFLFRGYNNAVTYKVGFLIRKKIQVFGEQLFGNPIIRDSVYGLKQTSYNFGINYILGKQK